MGASSSVSKYEVPAADDVDALQELADDLWGEQQISGEAVAKERVLSYAASRGVDEAYMARLPLPEEVDATLLSGVRSGLLAVACDLNIGGGGGFAGDVEESVVTGTAASAADGAAVAGARVAVVSKEGLQAQTTTDADGRFDAAVKVHGWCAVDCAADGFFPATAKLALPDEAATLGFALKPLVAGVYGVAVDALTGAPVAGALAERAGAAAALTGADGRFFVDGSGPARVTAPGYATCVLAVDDADGVEAKVAKLLPVLEARVDAKAGGSVEHAASGSTLAIPAASLVDASDGAPFDGVAAVAFAVIDAGDAAALGAMPGSFVDGSSGAPIQSWGACFVDLSDADDPSKKLKCPTGADVTLRKTVAEAAAAKLSKEEMPKAYQLDEDTGTWTELEDEVDLDVDGEMKKRAKKEAKPAKAKAGGLKKKGKCTPKMDYDNARDSLSVSAFLKAFAKDPRTASIGLKVRSSGFFNCDSPYKAVLITGNLYFMDDVKDLLANQKMVVRSVGVDYAGIVSAKANDDGDFSVQAQCDSSVDLELLFMLPGATDQFKSLSFGNRRTGDAGTVLDVGPLAIDREAATNADDVSTEVR